MKSDRISIFQILLFNGYEYYFSIYTQYEDYEMFKFNGLKQVHFV